jgi:hypothetical protein
MNMFKLTLLSLLVVTGITTSSCVKKHEQNYPHTEMNIQEVTITNWVGDANGYEGTIVGDELTPELLVNGVVMCYWKNAGSYTAMPLTFSEGTYISHWLFTQNASSISIVNYDDDGATPNPGSQTFKIAIFTKAGLINHPNVDINDYESVKKEFNL